MASSESPRSGMTGLQITHPLPAHVIVPMFELNFPRNQSFPGIAELWAVKAFVWTTKPTGSPTPESQKYPAKRVPAACLFYTAMCIFGHICPPISRKPEFSGIAVHVVLRVQPFYCKTTRWLAPESPRSGMTGLQITPPLPANVIVPNVRVKFSEKPEFSRNSRAMGREGTCMDYKTHWVSNSRKSKKYPAEEGTSGMSFLYGNVHFRSYLSPISQNQSFPGIAVHVV